jgi:hypothetical protein
VWDGHVAGPGGATPQRVRYNATQTAPGHYVVTVDATADGKKTLAALQVWTVAFDDGSNTTGVLTLAPAPGGDVAAAAVDDVDGGVFLPSDGASSCAFDFASVGFDAGVSTVGAAHPHGLRCFWALAEELRKDVSVGTLTLSLADAASGAAVGNFAGRRRPRKLGGATSWLGRYGQMGGFGVLLLLQVRRAPSLPLAGVTGDADPLALTSPHDAPSFPCRAPAPRADLCQVVPQGAAHPGCRARQRGPGAGGGRRGGGGGHGHRRRRARRGGGAAQRQEEGLRKGGVLRAHTCAAFCI